jgi:hypothetical protein
MGKVNNTLLMAMCTKEDIKMENLREQVNIHGKMVQRMKASFIQDIVMAKAYLQFRTLLVSQAHFSKTSPMVKASSITPMVIVIKDSLAMVKKMGMGS